MLKLGGRQGNRTNRKTKYTDSKDIPVIDNKIKPKDNCEEYYDFSKPVIIKKKVTIINFD